MGRYRGRKTGGRQWLAVLGAVISLALIVETVVVVTFSNPALLPAASAAAAPVAAPGELAVAVPIAASGTARVSQAVERSGSIRPRIHLEAPRPAAWPTPPTSALPGPRMPAVLSDAGPSMSEFLDRYLQQHNSPLTGLGREFYEQGRARDVDPRLLVAVAGNETGFGRLLTSRYNAFNWFYQGTWDSHFESWQEAITTVTKGIREHYLDEGRTTVVTLGAKYGPIGAENDPQNLNVNFVPNVTAFLMELGGNPEQLTFR